MKTTQYKKICLLACFFSYFTFSFSQIDLSKLDDAVVLVKLYDYKNQFIGHGSGFAINSDGHIVTNHHVVKGASSIKIEFEIDGKRRVYEADKILKADESRDLAIVSLKSPGKYGEISFLKLADSPPKKGDKCWAIGTPADPKYMNTISEGLVSNLYFSEFPKKIQTNAEITHGSSGGPLLNSKGEVIGVTSSGLETKDGARASINFAVWIGELKNIPTINKESLIDPNSIPATLSFYTNNQFSGSVYLYINGIYAGNFTKYFPSTAPSCGQEGTISRNLFTGNHSYSIKYASTGQIFSGTVYLKPGECKVFNVKGPNPYYVDPWGLYRNIFDDKKEYNMVFYTGISVPAFNNYYARLPSLAIPLIFERSLFNNIFAVRTRLEFYRNRNLVTSENQYFVSYPSNPKAYESSSYISSLTDFKIIWNRKYRFNFWAAPSVGINYFRNRMPYYEIEYNYNSNSYEIVSDLKENIENFSGISYGIRFGFDMYWTKRFYLTSDFGLMKIPPSDGIETFDFNLILGYRFNYK